MRRNLLASVSLIAMAVSMAACDSDNGTRANGDGDNVVQTPAENRADLNVVDGNEVEPLDPCVANLFRARRDCDPGDPVDPADAVASPDNT